MTTDEADDLDGSLLSDAVRAGGGLNVVLRVEVGVEEDDGVGRGEGDAESSSAGGEEEDEGGVGGGLVVKATDGSEAFLGANRAVQSFIGEAAVGEVVLENVEAPWPSERRGGLDARRRRDE